MGESGGSPATVQWRTSGSVRHCIVEGNRTQVIPQREWQRTPGDQWRPRGSPAASQRPAIGRLGTLQWQMRDR